VLSQVCYFGIFDFEILGLASKTQLPLQLRNLEIPKSAIGTRHFTIDVTLVYLDGYKQKTFKVYINSFPAFCKMTSLLQNEIGRSKASV
jgi:hypothetical protein